MCLTGTPPAAHALPLSCGGPGPCYEAWCALGPFSAAPGLSEGPGPRGLSFVSTSQPERGATGWLRTAGHSRVGDKLAGRPQPHVGGGGGAQSMCGGGKSRALHCGPRRSPEPPGVRSSAAARLRWVSQLPAPPAGPSPGLQCAISFQAFFPSTPHVLIVR